MEFAGEYRGRVSGCVAARDTRPISARAATFSAYPSSGACCGSNFGPDSDVDVLVEFKPGCHPGWAIIDVEEELSALLGGRAVDLVNPKYLNPHLRSQILENAVVQYEADRGTE